jgi:hypothetical protein
MPKSSPLAADRFTFKLNKRTLPKGELCYARFFEKGRVDVLADRSTGKAEEAQALIAAVKILAQLPLEKLALSKAAKDQDGFEAAERLRNMDLAAFFTWFWTPGPCITFATARILRSPLRPTISSSSGCTGLANRMPAG